MPPTAPVVAAAMTGVSSIANAPAAQLSDRSHLHSASRLAPANNGNKDQFTSHDSQHLHHQPSTSSLTSPLLPGPSSRISSFQPLPPATATIMGPLPPPAKDSVATMTKQHKQRQSRRRCIFAGTFIALALIAGGVTAYFTVFRNKGASSSASTATPNGPRPSGFPSNPADRNPTVTDLSRSEPRVTALPQIQFPISKPVAVPMDLVPPKRFGNGIVWGHHIWGDNYLWAPTIKEIQQRKGYTPGALGGFYHLASTGIDHPDWFLSHAKQAAEAQSWFFVTLEPRDEGLEIASDTLDKVVELLRRASVDIGATVIVRWAHEMNGAWYAWSQQPLKFIQVWRDLHARVKKAAPKVSLVWSPNIGQFDATKLKREPGSAEFAAMDTNKDGRIDDRDDPYTPYWPGKDYVDFIGISFFWFGPTWEPRTNALPPADMATSKLTKPFDILKFARDQGLPFVVSETGGVFYSDTKVEPGPGEVALKQAWWRLLMSIPDVAMVVYFDFIKKEDNYMVNSALTNATSVIEAFKEDSASRPLVFGPQPQP